MGEKVEGGILAREHLCLVLLTEEGLPVCSPASMTVCLCEWLRDWFILVHHPSHQSFTWDWVSKDDKSESLMWSKVSGSDLVWVNTKRRSSLSSSFPPPSTPLLFFLCHPLPVSAPSSHTPCSPFSRDIWRQCVDLDGFVNWVPDHIWEAVLREHIAHWRRPLSPSSFSSARSSSFFFQRCLQVAADWLIYPFGHTTRLKRVDCSSKCPIKIFFQPCSVSDFWMGGADYGLQRVPGPVLIKNVM